VERHRPRFLSVVVAQTDYTGQTGADPLTVNSIRTDSMEAGGEKY